MVYKTSRISIIFIIYHFYEYFQYRVALLVSILYLFLESSLMMIYFYIEQHKSLSRKFEFDIHVVRHTKDSSVQENVF